MKRCLIVHGFRESVWILPNSVILLQNLNAYLQKRATAALNVLLTQVKKVLQHIFGKRSTYSMWCVLITETDALTIPHSLPALPTSRCPLPFVPCLISNSRS